MRNKKHQIKRGWRAEWIKNGGEDIESSPVKLFNRMERENTTPIQRNQIIDFSFTLSTEKHKLWGRLNVLYCTVSLKY